MATELPDPSDLLPHRSPFLFVTEVTEATAGEGAKGYWQLTGEEDFFAGHFPGRPTLPGVLIVESLAQMGAIGVLMSEGNSGKIPLLAGTDKARFRRQVVPGDRLDLEVTLTSLRQGAGRGMGKATVDGERVCEVDMLFVLADA